MISAARREDLLDALRRGTVPRRDLDAFAVGVEHFEPFLRADFEAIARGSAKFKALRGEYGSGKTFFSRWMQTVAHHHGFACSEVQISQEETPLHRYETVYRRLIERLSTPSHGGGALRHVLESWFFALEEDALAEGIDEDDAESLRRRTEELLEERLASVSEQAPALAMALRAWRRAMLAGDSPLAEGLLAWISGSPTVAASVKRAAGVKGEIDHTAALGFLQGLLAILRDADYKGLVLVLDEMETLQRTRSDMRDKGLNSLRQLMDEIDAGRFPGLYLWITGTPSFYDSHEGVRRLAPLAMRLQTDFPKDEKFVNPRKVQIRLTGFDLDRLIAVGRKVRDLYAAGSSQHERIDARVDDAYLADFARALTGEIGLKVGLAPRVFLRTLVSEILDPVELYEEFDPRRDFKLEIRPELLTKVERESLGVNDVDLDLSEASA